jgi:hypothetical protein
MSALRYCGLTVGFLIVSQLSLLASGDRDARTKAALLLGGVLATLNALAAYACARWAASRSMRALIWAVLGGMTLRMLGLLALMGAAVALARVPIVPLVVSLIAYFSLFLVLELMVLPRLFRAVTP